MKCEYLAGVVEHARDPRTLEAMARGSLQLQGQCGLDNEFQANLNYIGKPCLKRPNSDMYVCHGIWYNALDDTAPAYL